MIAVSFCGRLGGDAQLKTAGNGEVLEMNVAVNLRRGQDESTVWMRVAYWGKGGAGLAQHALKGREVFVVGRLRPREYQKDGQTRTSLDVDATDVRLVGSRPEGQQTQQRAPQPRRGNTPAPPQQDEAPWPDDDTDLPF